ncbi:TPA: hypothetical protein ACGO9X_001290 [Streptococcus suis]
MATPLGAMRIELELDSSKFASNLNASKKAVNYFKAEARALDAAMRSTGSLISLKQFTVLLSANGMPIASQELLVYMAFGKNTMDRWLVIYYNIFVD